MNPDDSTRLVGGLFRLIAFLTRTKKMLALLSEWREKVDAKIPQLNPDWAMAETEKQ